MSTADLRETSRLIQEAVLAAADPRLSVSRALSPASAGFTACGVLHPVPGRFFLLAVGKASAGMIRAALDAVGRGEGRREGPRVSRGLVVIPHGYSAGEPADPRVAVRSAGHPVPDEGSLAAAREAIRLVEAMAENDVCLLLLSGGGSSLLSLPHPPLVLSDLIETGRLLIASGADIHQVNTVRRHLSAVAGGRLAARCRGTMVTLAVSDVVGDDLHAIASGPTVADPTTFADAAAILERFALLRRVPPAVRALIHEGVAGAVPETPKHLPARHRSAVIASGATLVEAASEAARGRGFAPHVVTTRLTGEAREAGRLLARAGLECLRDRRPLAPPACLIAAGETTVTVTGQGTGGRNQEIALSAAMELDGVSAVLLTSFATDGKEGNTEAAGAHASGGTLAAGRAAGLDARACLAANDSQAFLSAAGELIVTGPTGTNVNDITYVPVEKGG